MKAEKLKERRRVGAPRPLSRFVAVLLIVALIATLSIGSASFDESLGTYESADITLEMATDKKIDDAPVYLLTLAKGYEALLFTQCSKYDRVKVSGDSSDNTNIATNVEITRGSDLFEHAESDYQSGLVEEKGGYDYLLFSAEKNEFSFVTFTETITTVAYIVVEWERSSGNNTTAVKTALEAVLAQVTGENASNWYQSGDRFNGKPADTITNKNSGFWMEMAADNGPLPYANYVFNNPSATQTEVDTAVEALRTAIARLIPVTQINATALYELSQKNWMWLGRELREKGPNDAIPAISASDTSPKSFAAYTAARAAASAELAKLFAADGTATEYNDSRIEANVRAVTGAVNALQAAIDGLDKLTSGEDAQMAYESINRLAKRVFNPALLAESNFTAESWTAFLEARDTALAFYEAYDAPADQLGLKEAQAYVDAYRAFWDACYEGLIPVHTGTATLGVEDVYGLTEETVAADSLFGGIYTVDIPEGGKSLGNLLSETLGANYVSTMDPHDISYALGIYLNGIYLFNMDRNSANSTNVGSRGYEDVVVKPGDEILVARMRVPSSANMSGGATVERAAELIGDIRYLSTVGSAMTDLVIDAASGQTLELNAEYLLSMVNGYTGMKFGQANAIVYLSKCCATKAEAMSAIAAESANVKTDSIGNFTLEFYSAEGSAEGWYSLCLIDPGDRGGVACGINALIHVTDPEDLSALRAELTAKLDELLEAYPDEYYTETQLETIRAAAETARQEIGAAGDSGSIQAAYQTAEDCIKGIWAENEADNGPRMDALDRLLMYLPSPEDARAGAIYKGDLPILEALFDGNGIVTGMSDYQLSLLPMSTIQHLEILRAAYEASLAGTELPDTAECDILCTWVDEDSGEELDLSTRYSGYYTQVAAVSQRIPLRIRYGSQVNLDSGAHLPAPAGSMISYGLHIGENTGYTVVSAECDADPCYIEHNDRDLFTYWETSVNISIHPRTDLHVTIYVRSTEQADSYIDQLKAAFRDYDRADYSAEKWAELKAAYNNGLERIKQAEGTEAKESALTAALAAMEAVETLTAAEGQPIPGWGAEDAFDAGVQVGTITVTAENTTFPDGAYKGVFIEKPNYPIGENDNMMTVILRALADEGYTWNGTGGASFDISYLASISKSGVSMGEFSGDQGSGWMGSLNDFLVNEGLNSFSVANGGLSSGDVIKLMYTQNLGVDLGGSWGNSDTTLESLKFDVGTLLPDFASGEAGGSYEYALLLPGSTADVMVTPHANNINYMVKMFLNEKVTTNTEGNSYYKRTEAIPLHAGDILYVGVGEPAWPSMNKYGAEARSYSPTWYALHVITAENGADYVNELIAALPAVKFINNSNYEEVQAQIDAIDAVIAVLSSSEKARVNTDALEAVREAAANFGAVADLKAEIKALPKNITEADREAVEAAKAAYDALTAAQRNLLTVAETNKLQKAVNTLTLMDKLKTVPATKDFDSAAAGSQDALIAALKDWLGPDGLNIAESSRIMVEVGSFAEATAGGDGSYSATVSFILGDGSAAATQTKDISGVITRSGEAGVTGIKVSGVPATGSGAAWTATLPYGTDLKTLTGEAFEITLKDEKAQVTEDPAASNNGETWSFTVTALDGTTAAYTVTLSVSEVAVKVLDSWIYSLADDAEPVKLDPAAVTGLLEAVSVDALALPAGTKEAFLWLEVREKAGDNVYEIMPVFAADEEGSRAVPAAALIGKIGLTLPVPGTEYAKVLFGTEYLDAQGDANGIRFDVAEAGDYTLIPDARIATVTFHLCGGSSGEVTDGETVVYYREDLNKELPIAVKDDSGFAGWNAKEDGSGQVYSAVSAALPADLYAVWQTELPEELKITELTTAAAVISAVEEDGTAVITVKADVPCVVIMKTGDSYELLEGVENADGSYSFRQENYDESMEFFVAAKGDYDGDGVFRTVDLAKANMDLVANKTIDPLTILIMGVDSGKLRTVDLAILNLSIINKDLDW